MASKFKYRSKESKFGFRFDGVTKLMFDHNIDTEVTEAEAMVCEEYVVSGYLDRVGADPMEGKELVGIPTTVKLPGGKVETKSPAPNTDAREKLPEAMETKEPAKAK